MVTKRVGLVAPPGVLAVSPGDVIRVTSEFDYTGPAVSGKIYSALYHPTFLDPHDEIARISKDFSITDSPPPGKHFTGYVDLTVPEGHSGPDFGLYTKLIGIPGADIFSPYYDNIVEIVGAVPEFSNLVISSYVKR